MTIVLLSDSSVTKVLGRVSVMILMFKYWFYKQARRPVEKEKKYFNRPLYSKESSGQKNV